MPREFLERSTSLSRALKPFESPSRANGRSAAAIQELSRNAAACAFFSVCCRAEGTKTTRKTPGDMCPGVGCDQTKRVREKVALAAIAVARLGGGSSLSSYDDFG